MSCCDPTVTRVCSAASVSCTASQFLDLNFLSTAQPKVERSVSMTSVRCQNSGNSAAKVRLVAAKCAIFADANTGAADLNFAATIFFFSSCRYERSVFLDKQNQECSDKSA